MQPTEKVKRAKTAQQALESLMRLCARAERSSGDAMRLMAEIDAISERLPQLDCGSCGAPTCRALAEDIVRGLARENDCIFRMRRQIQDIANQLSQMEGGASLGEGSRPGRFESSGKERKSE